jgi:HK97 family phage major capsid protein
MKMEKRSYDIKATDKPLVIEGFAVVFDEPAQIGGITEIIARGALDGVDLSDVALLINHDGAGIPLARTPKTLTLEVTDSGLSIRAELPDTEQGRAVYEAVKRGDMSKMSFAFDIVESDFDKQAQTRTITKIGKIYEISAVNYAAYPQTSIQARAGKETDMNTTNPIIASLEVQSQPADTHATPEYRAAFFKTMLNQPLTDIETRAFDAAKAEKRADSFNTLSNSAAVIPTHTLNEIISPLHPQGGLWNEVRHFSVPANLAVPVGTPADPAQWHIEGAAVDRKDVTTHNVMFSAFELIKILSMSAAAKRMTISAFENYITSELRQSIVNALNTAILSGTGSGQPQGLLTGITWNAKNSLTVPANGIIDSLLKTIAKLPAGYANGAKFAMSNATLFTVIYPAKTDDGALILTPDAQNGNVRRLFGFEIVVDDNLPTDTILFGNFKYYGVNVPEGIAIETSRESGFANGLIDFRALTIADAKPLVPEAFIKLKVTAAA